MPALIGGFGNKRNHTICINSRKNVFGAYLAG
jgi:hypothetical protein